MSSSRKRPLEEQKAAERRKQRVAQPQTLHYGLYNQGATCYLNSVLQVLFMTTEMHHRLDPKSRTTDRKLRNLFENLKENPCGTENITDALRIDNVHQQRDAAEILELILQKISPQASEVFQGQLTYITKCSKGHIINNETNPFWTLPLPLRDSNNSIFSVDRGFERTFQTKTYSGDNMVYCNDCNKKRNATSGCEMVKCPQSLILLLKRFDFDYSTMSHFKSDCDVEVPCELQIKNDTYKLYGMVNHMGSLRGGHYTATVLSSVDETWYEFNDSHVSKVREQPFAKTLTYSSSTAYLLLYRVSGSLRNEMREPCHERGHLDEQRGRRELRESSYRESSLRESSLRGSSLRGSSLRESSLRESSLRESSLRGSSLRESSLGESVAGKENRHIQERHREMHRHQYPGEEGEPQFQKQVSSVIRDTAEEDSFLPKTQNMTYFSKQQSDSWTKPDKKKQSKNGKDENTSQVRKILDILKNPIVIFIIILCFALLVILPVVLTSLKSTSTEYLNP